MQGAALIFRAFFFCVCNQACTAQLELCPNCRTPIAIAARGEALAYEDTFVEMADAPSSRQRRSGAAPSDDAPEG